MENGTIFPTLGNEKRRNPFFAFILSLLLPGLGQLYNGNLVRAAIILFARVCLPYVLLLFGLLHHFYGLATLLILAIALYVYSIIDAVVVAIHRQRIILKRYQRSYIYILIIALMWSYSFFLPTESFIGMKAMITSGPSMEPTLMAGDRFVIDTHVNDLKRGDVVVFWSLKDGKQQLVKRVVALAGDQIEIKDNIVVLNGKPVQETYLAKANGGYRFGPMTIPQDQVFVLGDNRNISFDSHIFGPIPVSTIIGKANFIYYSRDIKRIGFDFVFDNNAGK
jgi:signal peptidase I